MLDSTRRLPALDGLRGVAVLMVIFFHYVLVDMRVAEPWVGYALWPFKLGWAGVDLFFVLSGFLIGGILLDHAGSPRYFQTFYARRACRIFPLYYLGVAVFAVGAALFDQKVVSKLILVFVNHGPVWTYATFTQNFWMAITNQPGAQFNAITWSLAIEEHFYLLLPLLVRVVPRATLPKVLAALVVLAVGARIALGALWPDHPYAGYLISICRMDALCLGVLCAWALRIPGGWERLKARRRALAWTAGGLTVGVIGLNAYDSRFASWTMSAGGYTLIAAWFAAIVLHAISFDDGWLARAAAWKPLAYVGQISFCLYLVHQPINVLSFAYLRNKFPSITSSADLLAPAIALAASFAVAAVSWKVLEGPFVRLGRKAVY